MRSTGLVEDADKTSRARLRDAAILCFARDGFGASVRSIATEAGVSAGLIIHHFGSKQALRDNCDSQVLAITRETKQQSIREVTAGKSLLHRCAAADEQGPLLGYIVRSLQDGGAVASAFIEHLIADAVAYCADGVRAGLLHPSLDEPARARYLTLSAMGALLLEIQLRPPADPADLSALVREFMSTSYLPMLELYTQGVFTTRRPLEEYLLTVPDRSPAE